VFETEAYGTVLVLDGVACYGAQQHICSIMNPEML
jgi:hypothetical protein